MNPNWTSLEYWKEMAKAGKIDNPFNDGIVGPESVFARERVSAPLPSGSTVTVWHHFPHPTAMARFLRHLFFSYCFSLWLGIKYTEEALPPVSELLQFALDTDSSPYCEDIPLMQAVIADIDAVLESDEREHQLAMLRSALDKFNARWSHTPSWDFEFVLLGNAQEAGNAVLEQYQYDNEDPEDVFLDERGHSKEEWQSICRNAGQDVAASEAMLQVLRDLFTC